MIKLIFCDISGTLLTTNGTISEETVYNISLLSKNDIKFVLCSGGSRGKTLGLASNIGLDSYIISSNGGDIYDIKNRKRLYENHISNDDIYTLYNLATKNNLFFSMNSESFVFVNKRRFVTNYEIEFERLDKNILDKQLVVQCTISGIPNSVEVIQEVVDQINDTKNVKMAINNFNLISSNSNNLYCDVVKSNTNKKNAAEKLMEYLEISPDESMVICDGINDVELFNLVKYRIAMGNAITELKEQATYVTSTNNENGVNNVLKKILRK